MYIKSNSDFLLFPVIDFQACVRRRAIESVKANPACPNEAAAERAVNEVWESCFNDTRPFDEVREILFHSSGPSLKYIH